MRFASPTERANIMMCPASIGNRSMATYNLRVALLRPYPIAPAPVAHVGGRVAGAGAATRLTRHLVSAELSAAGATHGERTSPRPDAGDRGEDRARHG